MTGPSNVTTEANRDIIRQPFEDWGDGTRPISDVFDGRGIAHDGEPYENRPRLVLEDARREGDRWNRALRQHLVQRPLDSRPTATLRHGFTHDDVCSAATR